MAKARYMWLSRPSHKDGRPGDVYPSSALRRRFRRSRRAMAATLRAAGLPSSARTLARAARNG